MSKFLLIFDRQSGMLRSLTEYDDARDAVSARLEAEKVYAQDENTEVVVLSARSQESLRLTHTRYFENFQKIASNALATREKSDRADSKS